MNVVMLMQSINQQIVDTTIQALPEGSVVTLLTGTDVCLAAPHIVVKTAEHSPKSLLSRLKCWWAYYRDIKRWYSQHKHNRVDMIYAVSNPPINSFIGLWLKKKFGAKFVYMEWDIYPQIIEQSISALPVKLVCKMWHMANNRALPKIDRMLTIGECMKQSICEPVCKPINISVVPIYTDIIRMNPISKTENPFRIEHSLQDKFVVIYSGKMGIGHRIPLILDAAKCLENEYPEVVFLMIGFGPGYEDTKKRIEEGAKNIILMEPQPDSVFPYSMASGDIGIVSEEAELAKLFLPSKSYDMMACGMPIVGICTECDDLQHLIEDNGVGLCVKDGSAQTLAERIIHLYQNGQMRTDMGCKARMLMEKYYSRDTIREQYREIFLSVGGNSNDQLQWD